MMRYTKSTPSHNAQPYNAVLVTAAVLGWRCALRLAAPDVGCPEWFLQHCRHLMPKRPQ